jgi:riboflavin synthase alpha subunit
MRVFTTIAKVKSQSRVRFAFSLVVLIASASAGQGQTVGGFIHSKIQNFEQTSSAAPAIDPAQPYQFGSRVRKGFATINGASVTLVALLARARTCLPR